MAFIQGFEKDERELKSRQPTDVICKYMSREIDGRRILQLNTYGSTKREIPEKLSQTLQLDAKVAIELIKLLQNEFGLK